MMTKLILPPPFLTPAVLKKYCWQALCLTFLLILLSHARTWGQTFGWSEKIGSETQSATAADGAGSAYVLAEFKGTQTYGSYSFTSLGGGSKTDLALVKYNKDGVVQWARHIGSVGNEYAGDVTISKYGSYLFITGSFSETVFFGSYHGYMVSPLSSQGSTDIFVARYEAASGTLQWSRQAGGTGSDYGYGIFTDVWGNDVYITGAFSGSSVFAPGTTISSYAGSSDAFFARYDHDGNFSLVRRFGGAGYDYGKSITVDKYYGNIYITGGDSPYSSPYIVNFFLAKFNAAGSYTWSRHAGGGSYLDSGNDVVLNSSGHYVYVTGTFSTPSFTLSGTTLPPYGSADAFIAKYYENGNLLWARTAGGSGWDEGQSIAEDGGKLYISGTFSGTASFGHTTFSSYGYGDIFISQLTAGGDFRWSSQLGSSNTDYGRGNIAVAKYNMLYFSGHRGTISWHHFPLYPSGSYVWKITPPAIPFVTEFRLINADTDTDVKKINGFEEIKYSNLGTKNMNIQVNTSPATVGSVVMKLDDKPLKTENYAPYAYAGDQPKAGGGVNYKAFSPTAGTHKLEATPYSGPDGSGVKGDTKILFFTITDDLRGSRMMAYNSKAEQPVPSAASASGELQLQVYPNPVSEDSRLSFSVPEGGQANVVLYDMLGNKVREIFNGQVQAGEVHTLALESNDLTNTMYICQLTVGSHKIQQKLLKMPY